MSDSDETSVNPDLPENPIDILVESRLARKFLHVTMNPVTEGLKELARKHMREIIEAESQAADQQQQPKKDENTAPKT